ncbi:hypothetical protein F5Y17DRAFT_395020 [Xylariaceae sp. FL0594]|nr:hypothetical protein F5Y17DRAFT_395020 [Xylariaceae sp. FL0594]
MAATSLPPDPQPVADMSTRRIPLSANQNIANSPLRNATLKQKRTLAQIQREEPYGQPPPAKKLILDHASQRVIKSPSQQPRVAKSQIPVQTRRGTTATVTTSYESRTARARTVPRTQQQSSVVQNDYTEKDIRDIQTWQDHHRARFPKSLFYFDQIANDVAHKLKKQIASLGGRETAFFSVDVTHIVTSRPIPVEDKPSHGTDHGSSLEKEATQKEAEQSETINPSLLTRNADTSVRRLFDAELRARGRLPAQSADQAMRAPKKAADILIRAKEMGKKIWTVEKLFRLTALLQETDPYRSLELAYGRRKSPRTVQSESRAGEDRNLLRLLQNERVNGPSDRDPTVQAQELVYFKGPYIYVYDIEEKKKPIMIKEYPKPADKSKGKWPQFQTASLGRCPFVEDSELREGRKAKEVREAVNVKAMEAMEAERARVRALTRESPAESAAVLQPPRMAPPKPVTGKRTLGQMELAHARQSSVASAEFPSLSRTTFDGGSFDFSRKAFSGRTTSNRLVGGEPVASGVQPSNVTSAIRSNMVSSTAATPGVITGLSKEVHGLQRQVLQRHSAAASQDANSLRMAGRSVREESSTKRPQVLSRTSSRKQDIVDNKTRGESARRQESTTTGKESDRELKPGYCENCGEKYPDFDEHIESKGHRKFAEDDANWVELDELLAQLERIPKRHAWKPSPSWGHSRENEVY